MYCSVCLNYTHLTYQCPFATSIGLMVLNLIRNSIVTPFTPYQPGGSFLNYPLANYPVPNYTVSSYTVPNYHYLNLQGQHYPYERWNRNRNNAQRRRRRRRRQQESSWPAPAPSIAASAVASMTPTISTLSIRTPTYSEETSSSVGANTGVQQPQTLTLPMRPASSMAAPERVGDSITTVYPGQRRLEYPLPPRPPIVEASEVMVPEVTVPEVEMPERVDDDNEDQSDWLIDL